MKNKFVTVNCAYNIDNNQRKCVILGTVSVSI
ncbi:uncharacterized protein METZ01_LOCUS19530 [marine metagenome]|uniref:Uncharacterized protein n=1 Tax=marine metagenome TaxID=408172 RepID=A0A381PI46_9ZZZZ